MSEWREIVVGAHLKLTSGFPFASERFGDEGFPLIRIRDILSSVTETYFQGVFPPGYIIKAGDILVGMDGDFNVVKWRGCDALLNQRVLKVDVVDESAIALDFVFHWLGPFIKKVNETTAATTVKHLSTKDLLKAKAVFPNVPAQRRIATILTAIDTTIEKTEALIDKYRQIKAGLMHDLFTRGVLPNGQLRPPRCEAPELYQETAIGWIPKEWSLMKIGTAFDIQLGKMLNQGARTGKSSFPYVGNRSVQWGRVDVGSLEEMDFSPVEREKFSLLNGDLLVCEGGDVGRTAIWESPIENCYYQKAIHRLRAKGNHVKPRFMLRFMWHAKSTGHFDNYTSQTSIAHLTQEKLAEVPMPAPRLDEQNRLIKHFDGLDSILEREQVLLAKLRQQKLGLMQDLLTGKVPVTPQETEIRHA